MLSGKEAIRWQEKQKNKKTILKALKGCSLSFSATTKVDKLNQEASHLCQTF